MEILSSIPLVLLAWILLSTGSAAAQSPELKKFLESASGLEQSGDPELELSPPYAGYDGKIYVCCRKSLLAFESDGSISWIIPLNYSCHMDIAPVGDDRGKIFVAAENRILKIKPANIGTSEPVIETIYSPNPEIGHSNEIIGISISIPSSALFITIKNHGVFAFMIRGTLLWSAVPVLDRFGYLQGCKAAESNCSFNSAPIVDQCEGILYISNSEGQLYAIYTISPHFRWIKDLSWVDKLFSITPGNNGHVYITFPVKSVLMALDVSSGNLLWRHSIGPLSEVNASPVVDSNGWVSIGSMDGFLYSVSPDGDLRKFLKSSAVDSVIRVNPLLDCSGFAVYVAQSQVEAKISRVIGNYTYVSGTNPTNLVFFVLSTATGAVYSRERISGDQLSRNDLRFFKSDERLLLALLASGRNNSPWPCYTTRQKLMWTCSQANPKNFSIYTESEKAVVLLLLFQLVITLMLAAIVRFCWVFWRKKKLKEKDLGEFLEKRRSLHSRKAALTKVISELEEKVSTAEPTVNGVMDQLEGAVNARERIERKLLTTYSLGRDVVGPRVKPLLPLYGGRPKSYSFHGIFNTLGDSSSTSSVETSDEEEEDEEAEYSSWEVEPLTTLKRKEVVNYGSPSGSKKSQPGEEMVGPTGTVDLKQELDGAGAGVH